MDLEDILAVLLSMNDDGEKEIIVDIYDDFFIVEAN